MKEAWLDAVEGMPVWAAWVLLGFHFLAPCFHAWQNHDPKRLGGPISRAKAAWLVHVSALWLVLPVLLSGVGWAYLWLAVSMGVRTVIELPLCGMGKWKTIYGVSHDVVHLALVAVLLPGGEATIWLWLTALTLVAEIHFVFRFKKCTAGPAEGIFFVPDGPRYAGLNLLTDFVRMPSQYLMVSVLIAACLK
jgi:hypothetical protein